MPRFRRPGWLVAALYALLVAVSGVVERSHRVGPSIGTFEDVATVHVVTGASIGTREIRLAFRRYEPPTATHEPPVVLVHGSPGRKGELDRLASRLATRFHVIVPDLPGFGDSEHSLPDYSFRAHAVYLEQLIDALEIPRIHIVGFSMGGGVALSFADIAPRRMASLTMLSAIGVQEMELTGDYHVNHVLHAIQLAALWCAQAATPHFGLLNRATLNVPYARNFFDSDQRPLRDVLRRVAVPTLIIHGRDDGQVPIEAAREHARLVPQSELVVLDGNHFLAFDEPDALAGPIADFLQRADQGMAPGRAAANADRIRASLPMFVGDGLPPARGISAAVFTAIVTVGSFSAGPAGFAVAGTLAARGRISLLAASVASVIGALLARLVRALAGRPGRLRVANRSIDTVPRLLAWDVSRATAGVSVSAAIAAVVLRVCVRLSLSSSVGIVCSICVAAATLFFVFSRLNRHPTSTAVRNRPEHAAG